MLPSPSAAPSKKWAWIRNGFKVSMTVPCGPYSSVPNALEVPPRPFPARGGESWQKRRRRHATGHGLEGCGIGARVRVNGLEGLGLGSGQHARTHATATSVIVHRRLEGVAVGFEQGDLCAADATRRSRVAVVVAITATRLRVRDHWNEPDRARIKCSGVELGLGMVLGVRITQLRRA